MKTNKLYKGKITDKTDICNEFNNSFVSIGTILPRKCRHNGNPFSYTTNFFYEDVSLLNETEVRTVISTLKYCIVQVMIAFWFSWLKYNGLLIKLINT